MSKHHDNRWKKLRRKPSSTAGARNALALAYSIQPDVRLEVGDNGTMFTATLSWRDRSEAFSEPTLPLVALRANRIISGWSRKQILDQSEAMRHISEAYLKVCESNRTLLELYVGRSTSR